MLCRGNPLKSQPNKTKRVVVRTLLVFVPSVQWVLLVFACERHDTYSRRIDRCARMEYAIHTTAGAVCRVVFVLYARSHSKTQISSYCSSAQPRGCGFSFRETRLTVVAFFSTAGNVHQCTKDSAYMLTNGRHCCCVFWFGCCADPLSSNRPLFMRGICRTHPTSGGGGWSMKGGMSPLLPHTTGAAWFKGCRTSSRG